MNLQKLDEIYKIYRFEKKNSGYNNIRVYTYTSGYFSNADIIPVDGYNIDDLNKVKSQFEELGYSNTIRKFNTIEEVDSALFNGFFSISSHLELMEEIYQDYCRRCSHAIEGAYTYIPGKFVKLNGVKEQKSDLMVEISNCLNMPLPQMIVLEAPAGFGKTTTVNELIHKLCTDGDRKIPFVAELSRNRQAQIFKYVLLDELDRQFPALKLDLVVHHIKNGNIILIIDGFDELLTKTENGTAESLLITAEPMLETISQLLSGNAKVILTTRKSAIFSGDYFHEWIEKHSTDFSVSRYEICEPSAKDWLNEDRLKKIKDKGLDIETIPNPILLAWLRARSDSEFDEIVQDNNADSLINRYFERLLEREMGRQKLHIDPSRQKEIFTSIALYFANHNISSEQKEYLAMFLSDKYGGMLEDVARTYPPEERLTEEMLVDKLTNHAFLDRKVSSSLGFVNDFFFGYFIGESILNSEIEHWEGASQFIELASSAFRGRSEEARNSLWNKLDVIIDLQKSNIKYIADVNLKKKICRNYKYEIFEEIEFDNIVLGNDLTIDSSLFNSCDFKSCKLILRSMLNTNYVRCHFYNCEFDGDIDASMFPGCTFIPEIDRTFCEVALNNSIHFGQWELHVLRKFWPEGQSRMFVRRKISTLKMGAPVSSGSEIDDAIDQLNKKGYLRIEGHLAVCAIDKINEVKTALGR